MVGQWLQAAASDPASRRTASGSPLGIAVVQVLWLARLVPPGRAPWQFMGFFVLVGAAEIAVPVIAADAAAAHRWHPHHIAERYRPVHPASCSAESLLASANAIIGALGEGEHVPELIAARRAGSSWWPPACGGCTSRAGARTGRINSLRGGLLRSATCTTSIFAVGRRGLGGHRGRDRRDHRARDLPRGRGARPYSADRAVRAERVGDPAAADAVTRWTLGRGRQRRDPDRGERAAADREVCRLGAAPRRDRGRTRDGCCPARAQRGAAARTIWQEVYRRSPRARRSADQAERAISRKPAASKTDRMP